MKIKIRALSIALAAVLVFTVVVNALLATALTPADHIVGNFAPPTETSETDFTVSVTTENCWQDATNNYWQRFDQDGNVTGQIENFFFVTGDPNKAYLHDTIIQIVRDSGTYDALVIYRPRVDVDMNGHIITNVSHLPNEFHWNAGIVARENRTYFLDSGKFTDPLNTNDTSTDRPFLDSMGLSAPNLSIVGLSECPVDGTPIVGEDVATIVRIPAECRPHTNTSGNSPITNQAVRPRTLRYHFLSHSNYLENLIFDGQELDMSPANGFGSGGARGQYLWVLSGSDNWDDGSAMNFVARDIVFQNIGATNTQQDLGLINNISLGTNRDHRNTPIMVIRATQGTRHFENIITRDNRVTAGNDMLRINNSSNVFVRNFTVEGTVQNATARTISIESGDSPDDFVGPHRRDQGNIIIDGDITIPNRGSIHDSILIQDYRYHNIRVPSSFGWAQLRTVNGAGATPAIRVFNHKQAPVTGFVPFELNTGYFYAEAAVTSPDLQTQLNSINTMLSAANTQINNKNGAADETLITNLNPNIKIIANANGELSGFSVPNFLTSANIVALRQTETPLTSLHAAGTHASGANPTEGAPEWVTFTGENGALALPLASETRAITLFNFDFRAQANWTIDDATTGDPNADPTSIPPGIVNFTEANSGRNLFLRYVIIATFYDTNNTIIEQPQTLTPGTAPTAPSVTVPPGFDLRWTVNDGAELFTSEQINNTNLDESTDFYMVLVPQTNIAYTVNHFIYGTTTSLADSVTHTGQTMGTTVTENALNIPGWNATQATQTIVLSATENVIIFYYEPIMVPVTFEPGTNGALQDGNPNVVLYVQYGTVLTADDIPAVIADQGWNFTGWAEYEPLDFIVTVPITFTAQYDEATEPPTSEPPTSELPASEPPISSQPPTSESPSVALDISEPSVTSQPTSNSEAPASSVPQTPGATPPQTGDNGNIAMWSSLFTASLLALALIVAKINKKQRVK